MRRGLALLLTAAAVLTGCGSDDGGARPPQGPPAERVGAAALDALTDVERIRAELTAASDLYAIGERDAALVHLVAARDLWLPRSLAVRRGDPVLEREVEAAFARVDAEMGRGATFDTVRDRLSPLSTQLLDGVREEVAPKAARLDAGAGAVVLTRLAERLQGEYIADGERGAESAYGLVVRCQAVARDIAEQLGPQRDVVVNTIKDLRADAFPDGADLPARRMPGAELDSRLAAVRAALAKRFGL